MKEHRSSLMEWRYKSDLENGTHHYRSVTCFSTKSILQWLPQSPARLEHAVSLHCSSMALNALQRVKGLSLWIKSCVSMHSLAATPGTAPKHSSGSRLAKLVASTLVDNREHVQACLIPLVILRYELQGRCRVGVGRCMSCQAHFGMCPQGAVFGQRLLLSHIQNRLCQRPCSTSSLTWSAPRV